MRQEGFPDPTRAAGLSRLAAFAPRMGRDYAATRNHDFGPGDRSNISLLSAHVRHRLVLERELVATALAHHAPSACDRFVQEVFWRSYWKGWLEQRPSVWAAYRARVGDWQGRLRGEGGLRRAYEDAVSGRTGIACFDAWAGELVETGYLHNHTRMWFASIWIFTLRLPWELGADFTYRHFLDGDPASNTLSWRWVAGLHTRGKHYLARAANIRTYTQGRFDPAGALDERAPPLAEDTPHPSPTPLPPADPPPSGRVALLLTEEDLNPETLPLAPARVVAVAGVLATEERSPFPIGRPVRDFAEAALLDGLARAADAFAVPAGRLASFDAAVPWAKGAAVDAVVTAYAPVGPVAARLDRLATALRGEGIGLLRLRRDWDEAIWPHATRGYFQVKDRIPEVLAALGLGQGRAARPSRRAAV
ncbi:FAD-binding domain-containing protein [Elioraea thermophila]|uniref:FAD-binding domain-containing protein n=1 Tax=Elioraea thermophila TaxID=2185104 RepID=UPI000DF35D45|nr:FAD-binding domain-containing protein [Elioraea thermophila]